MPKPAADLWTVNRLAEVTGLARASIAERLRGVPPDGFARKNVPGWRMTTVLRPLIEAAEVQRERARLVASQADLAALELAKRRGELLPADEVARADEAIYAAIRDAFLALPAAIADQLCEIAAAEGPAGVDQLLRDRIGEILTDAAEMEIEAEE
jgi:phage terminase Nu1 subunit (DNA packaging protein)